MLLIVLTNPVSCYFFCIPITFGNVELAQPCVSGDLTQSHPKTLVIQDPMRNQNRSAIFSHFFGNYIGMIRDKCIVFLCMNK